MDSDNHPRAFLGVLTALGVALYGVAHRASSYRLGDVVDPASVSDLAARFPADEDQFILSAWQYVYDHVQYRNFASNLHFENGTLVCQDCFEAEQTVGSGWGNCVSDSFLLASILRNRLPASRVYVSVGELRKGYVGGHAWVMVERRDGEWYVLEATGKPEAWVKASDVLNQTYKPYALFNDSSMACYDNICLTKPTRVGCNCQQESVPWEHSQERAQQNLSRWPGV